MPLEKKLEQMLLEQILLEQNRGCQNVGRRQDFKVAEFQLLQKMIGRNLETLFIQKF